LGGFLNTDKKSPLTPLFQRENFVVILVTLNSRFNIKFDKNHWQSFAPQRAFGLLPPNRFKRMNVENARGTAGSRPATE
jgi:hypothetical protein